MFRPISGHSQGHDLPLKHTEEEILFLGLLDPEDWTDMLSPNIGTEIPLYGT
jgi:hypothetical protein